MDLGSLQGQGGVAPSAITRGGLCVITLALRAAAVVGHEWIEVLSLLWQL